MTVSFPCTSDTMIGQIVKEGGGQIIVLIFGWDAKERVAKESLICVSSCSLQTVTLNLFLRIDKLKAN